LNMAFPLAAIGTGMSLLGGLEGLFGGASAQRQAEQARQQAITDFQQAGEQQYSDALAGGQRNLYGLTGTLNDALLRTGRGLGAANAAAGVYNSSAVSGSLANQGAANAQQLAGFQGDLAAQLAAIKNQTNQQAAQMRLGLATGDVNYARQRLAGSEQGIGSALGTLGQLNFGGVGAALPANTGQVTAGKSPLVTMPGYGMDYNPGGYGMRMS
jgi:hypothetical protein